MNKRRKILLSTALAVTLGLTGCGDKEDKLRYQYNSETKTEELVGTTDSLYNLAIVKMNNFNNQPGYYVVFCYSREYLNGKYIANYRIIGTEKSIESYGDIIYIIDLNKLAYYWNGAIANDVYTAEEINEMIEKLKADEDKLLNDDKVLKRIKP